MSGYVPLNEGRYRAHAKLLDAVGTGHRVLDVGCSSGYLARPLMERGNTIVGLELDPDAAREAEAYCERVLVGDVETMELPLEPGTFDVVLCGDVVEHLREPVAALVRLRPLLKPGGRLVLSTPNVANWAIRLSLLAATVLVPRGKERLTAFREVKKLYGIRSKAVHGEPLPAELLASGVQGSFQLLRMLLLDAVSRGAPRTEEDFLTELLS